MGRKKSLKLAEVDYLHNVFSYSLGNIEERLLKYLDASKPFVLELGCGRGDYSITLAERNPEKNFVGMDIRGARIWNGSKKADELKLKNVAFVISRAEFLPEIFKITKFEEIWIPFPDPFPKKRSTNRRLIAPGFLERYSKITMPGTKIHLKTDDDGLYNYALEVLTESDVEIIRNYPNLYAGDNLTFEESIKTKYEEQHLREGKTIKLISFKLR
jgi:tRNA (guanine-N7-)-methyltransferase